METILQRLKKIEALAAAGTAGERANAQRLLNQLCGKYGVTLQEIVAQKKSWHAFKVRGRLERRLFCCVLVHVVQTLHVRHTKTAHEYKCELTTAQAIDVQDCWNHYRTAWREQLADFFTAFVHKNRIFGPPADTDCEADEETQTRARRIFELMAGMDSRPWEKRMRLPCLTISP